MERSEDSWAGIGRTMFQKVTKPDLSNSTLAPGFLAAVLPGEGLSGAGIT